MKKRNAKHYSSEEWVDFAMEQTPQSQRAEMQQHLDTGCKPCAELRSLWTRVGRIAERERSLQPPASAVYHVRAAFASLMKARQAERAPLIPRLVFDSLWQPALAGIRSGATSPQKLLYKARDISIEMHIEPENKSERMSLTGQICIATFQGQSMPPISVTISSEEGKLVSTETNGFGEFHLSYVLEAALQISFTLIGGVTLVIPLDSPAERTLHRI
jgi:hypothetical protein